MAIHPLAPLGERDAGAFSFVAFPPSLLGWSEVAFTLSQFIQHAGPPYIGFVSFQ